MPLKCALGATEHRGLFAGVIQPLLLGKKVGTFFAENPNGLLRLEARLRRLWLIIWRMFPSWQPVSFEWWAAPTDLTVFDDAGSAL